MKFAIDVPAGIAVETDSQERQIRKILIFVFIAMVASGLAFYVSQAVKRQAPQLSPVGVVETRQTIISTTLKIIPNGTVPLLFTPPTSGRDPELELKLEIDGAGSVGTQLLNEARWKAHSNPPPIFQSDPAPRLETSIPLPTANERLVLLIRNPSPRPVSVKISATMKTHVGSR
jgi:hypothetical protein